jgi:RNA polymerase sigma-70 factor (ECF subfamily)
LADIVAGFAVVDQDAGLIEDLRAGSDRAFATLLSLYQRPIYNFVFRLLDDPADAPDVTQEVFLKVFRNIGDFRGDCSLKTWIYRIAVNEASNLRRWFCRHRRNEVSLDDGPQGRIGFAGTLPDRRESQYEHVLRQERMRAVEVALSQIKESFRVPVVLRDIEGLTYEEIAEILQVSLGTVKSRILRGREALKQKLSALSPENAPGRNMVPCALEVVE